MRMPILILLLAGMFPVLPAAAQDDAGAGPPAEAPADDEAGAEGADGGDDEDEAEEEEEDFEFSEEVPADEQLVFPVDI